LVSNDQKLAQAKHRLAALKGFSPVQMFQRLDRASKGYLTHEDLTDFYRENDLQSPNSNELKLIVRSKTTYQRFVSLLLDKDHTSEYFR